MTFEADFYDLIENAYQFIDDEIFNEEQKEMLLEGMEGYNSPIYISKMCDCHMFVNNFVGYDNRDIPVPRGLGTTAQRLEGDCTDQSVMLASLCETFGIGTRLVSIDVPSGGAPHMIVEMKSPKDESETIAGLRNHYLQYTPVTAWELDIIPSETTPNTTWFPVDPTGSQYVGDIRSLVANGYIQKTGSSNMTYTNKLLSENIDALNLSEDQSRWGASREADYGLKGQDGDIN